MPKNATDDDDDTTVSCSSCGHARVNHSGGSGSCKLNSCNCRRFR